MATFTIQDMNYITSRGSNPEEVEKRFSFFEKGFPFAHLDRAATIQDGIVSFDNEQVEELAADYPNLIKGKSIVKFIPASGAASRMFKELYSYLESDKEEVDTKAKKFLTQLPKFPFYRDLENVMAKNGYSLVHEIEFLNYKLIIRYILDKCGLNYGNLPKGVLKFHLYQEQARTAVEEHLVEAALYAKDENNICQLHFTVSPQHITLFEKLIDSVAHKYETRFGVKYQVEYSIQDPSTDTLAADENNNPFRNDQDELLFRPGGHGALISNLNKLHSDIVFVKNIDNVTVEKCLEPTVIFKKVLAAYLIELQNKTFEYLKVLEHQEADMMMMCEIIDFAETDLSISIDTEKLTPEALYNMLNRPIRVCGMVKNEGEPGGGPFWTINSNGDISLQIVESSQIDFSLPEQKAIVDKATHFNPVDMVCSFKNYKGEYFDLSNFIDENTGFISSKSYGDRVLKAMELPGLWNGAMAKWITVFVEVPLATFNPVKTVFDLLKRN